MSIGLGFRPYEQIPAYGAAFDVALMPWLRNDWIEHSNPIKLKEYLALGLPVVSTDFPEVHYYSDAIAIARDADQFVELVREALDGRALGTQADAKSASRAERPGIGRRRSWSTWAKGSLPDVWNRRHRAIRRKASRRGHPSRDDRAARASRT